MEICRKDQCVGCGMCVNVCLKNAITMVSDKRGFLYPWINEKQCIDCGLCTKKCPANTDAQFSNSEPCVYVAWNKNKKSRKTSTSGGIFSLLALEILELGGIVCGVKWNEKFQAKHCIITDEKDLPLLQGSKYVQSITGDIYNEIKEALEKKRFVLFSGTPCQVDALYRFLGKDYETLCTVDLVCHGVPPYDMLEKHLNELSGNRMEEITNVWLRHKSPCWSFSSVKVNFKSSTPYQKLTVDDAFFNLFNFNYSLRESCYQCPYTRIERVSDITLCDFWGFVPKSFKMADFDNGVSGIMVNTEKGSKIFGQIKKKIVFEKSSVAAIKKTNQSLSRPFSAPRDVEDFWQEYEEGRAISQLNRKYVKKPYRKPKYLCLRRIKRQYQWIFGR